MAPKLFGRLPGTARRAMVQTFTRIDELPFIGRVTRPISELGMRFVFDEVSGDWERIRSDDQYWDGFREALRLLPKGFRPRQVLDASTGTGMAATMVLERWNDVKVTGVDISPRMVRLAAQRIPTANFLRGSVHNLPFDDARFDLVVSLDGKLDIPEMLRVLHRKGRLVVVYSRRGTTPIARPLEQIAKLVEDADGIATIHTDGQSAVLIARHRR
jgi:ubiquinone/menaquinone biosynthesis C-methylase UbiE